MMMMIKLSRQLFLIIRILRIDHGAHMTYCVVVEREVVAESAELGKAVNMMMAAHYVFNISYYKDLSAVYIFLQHCYFEIPEKKLPIRVMELYTLITKQNTAD